MLSKEFHGVKVSGLACAVPDNKVMTDSYREYFGDAVVDRFIQATGIEGRFLSDGTQTVSDLSFVAADRLMNAKGLSGEDFDAVVLITQTEDYKIPATSFLLHKRLGIKKDCLVFDVNLGCSGYVNGVYFISGLIESGTINRALLLVGDSDTDHKVTDNTSFTMMFGDASSATILERGDGTIRGMIRSDGEGFNTLITPVPGYRFPGVHTPEEIGLQKKMNGDDVFLFTITQVPRLFKEFYSTYNCSSNDFDYYIFHQANLMIVNQIAKKLKLPPEKVPISLDRYGNTDGASVPVGIVDVNERMPKTGKTRFITSGFGIGLSWGVVSLDIESSDILPMIFTKDYYAEGKDV